MQDHRVLIALDGEQALTLAEAERPDVVLLDISMLATGLPMWAVDRLRLRRSSLS